MMQRDSRGNEGTDTSTGGILGPKKRCRHVLIGHKVLGLVTIGRTQIALSSPST